MQIQSLGQEDPLKKKMSTHSSILAWRIPWTEESGGLPLDYCGIEWFALEMKRDHSVDFEIASKYCILDSFVDHDGYSISCKGFLPTVVDIMVI